MQASCDCDRLTQVNTRHEFLYSSTLALFGMRLARGARFGGSPESDSLHDRLAQLERESGGRIGAALLKSESRRAVGYRVDEPFPMCSTFKVLAVAHLSKQLRQDEILQRIRSCCAFAASLPRI